jgi:hypothetical protein
MVISMIHSAITRLVVQITAAGSISYRGVLNLSTRRYTVHYSIYSFLTKNWLR